MNLDYLGDALDRWKGSLFEHLRVTGDLCDLAVDAMAADLAQWGESRLCSVLLACCESSDIKSSRTRCHFSLALGTSPKSHTAEISFSIQTRDRDVFLFTDR